MAELRRVPKQKRALNKYNSILDASIVVLIREGYDKTNTSNIAQEAGVAVGSLYEYFPNKESVFTEFLASRIEGTMGLISDSTELSRKEHSINKRSLKEKIKSSLDDCFKNKDLLRVLFNQIPGVLGLLSIQDIENKSLYLAKYLAEGIDLNEEQLSVKTYMLSNILYGFVIRMLFSETSLTTDEIAQELYKIICAYAEVE
jgi:AcrR family transcriptional regulator